MENGGASSSLTSHHWKANVCCEEQWDSSEWLMVMVACVIENKAWAGRNVGVTVAACNHSGRQACPLLSFPLLLTSHPMSLSLIPSFSPPPFSWENNRQAGRA